MFAKNFWLVIAMSVALGGCALGRDEVKLSSAPLATKSQVPSKGRTVFIRTVTDERVFAKNDNDTSLPSLEKDGDKADVRARAVSRKRNGYGMALGDVTLSGGQTVAGQVSESLRQAFHQAGYTVVTDAGATKPIIVDVKVKKFWTWHKVSFTAITVISDIQTEVSISGAKAGPLAIAVHLEDDKLVGGADATVESLDKALSAYRTEAIAKFAAITS
jgi:hypothetical protein